MRLRLIATALLLAAGSALAQQAPPPLATLEIDAWVGQRFVLLPKPAKAQQYGYRSFVPALPYAEWLGRVLTVTQVENGSPAIVSFKADDGTIVRAEAYYGSVHDIGLLRDLELARQRWEGKALWLRVAEILVYDAAADKFTSLHLGSGAHVNVRKVVAGSFDDEPVRFILVADDGREGFLDVQWSGTNVSKSLRGTDAFDQLFLQSDPHASR